MGILTTMLYAAWKKLFRASQLLGLSLHVCGRLNLIVLDLSMLCQACAGDAGEVPKTRPLFDLVFSVRVSGGGIKSFAVMVCLPFRTRESGSESNVFGYQNYLELHTVRSCRSFSARS